jgi:hypothetical protein
LSLETGIAIIGIVVTVGIPIIGYVVANLRGYIKGVSDSSKERFEHARQEIIAAEVRFVAGIAAAEARCVAQVKDTEARAERSDERILAHVNSQFSEVNSQLREIRSLLSDK